MAAAALCSVFLCAVPVALHAQQLPAPIVAPGNAAVTGFSGALPPVEVAPGVDPYARTFIDLNGPSLRVVDLQHMGGPPAAQLVGAPKPFTFSATMTGQVFGVALDDASPPNIYAAATSVYGLPIVKPGPDGQLQHIKIGAPNATFMPGLWGPEGGPGSIWKIDGVTGRVSQFANLMLDGRANSGPALGGIAYDPSSKSLFVADRETGFIHRFGMDGQELGRYDHGISGRAAQGLPPVQWSPQTRVDLTSPRFDSGEPATWNYAAPERRVFAVAVHQRRLYYAVADGLQIWSVGLLADGAFADDAMIELAVPPASGPTEISKITFDEQGRLYLAERPAPTGAFDFEALAVPAIGRVLRYALIATPPAGHHLWQELPDEYAIGFPGELRNGNGGVAIGYNYDGKGDIIAASCGGFLWTTGEDLRDSPDTALAARLSRSGPLHVDGLQGNGTWRIKRNNEPPLVSYFIDYVDEMEDAAARGHMGDIAIVRPCTPPAEIYPSFPPRPPPGAPPVRHGGPGTPPIPPPGTPPGTPPGGSCLPNQLRNAADGRCVPGCARPNVQVNGKCCSVATLAANASCSNSNCPSGQTAIGPSNFCCNSSQVYTGVGGAQACCNGQVVNGRCQPPTTPPKSNCPSGYVTVGGSCCLTTQVTSTGVCCPSGQVPSGPNKSQCKPPILIPVGPFCMCTSGLIPTASGKCCPPANVTTNGVCCSGPVSSNNRSTCPAQPTPACAKGYTRMPDGNCCNNRFISDDGMSCKIQQAPCGRGEFRDSSGACVPVVPTPPSLAPCAPDQVRDDNGNCVGGGLAPPPPPPPVIGRGGRPHPHPIVPPRGPRRPIGPPPHSPPPGVGRTFR